MNWYKKAQYYFPYPLETMIKMNGDNGLAVDNVLPWDQKEAKEKEKLGIIKKVIKQDKKGKYLVYVMNENYVPDFNESKAYMGNLTNPKRPK